MKRISFASAEELIAHCRQENVALVVEYQDENNRQRQVTLAEDTLADVEAYLRKPNAMAYYRKDGIFYEIVAAWLRR